MKDIQRATTGVGFFQNPIMRGKLIQTHAHPRKDPGPLPVRLGCPI
jgi:hypothetical protein